MCHYITQQDNILLTISTAIYVKMNKKICYENRNVTTKSALKIIIEIYKELY